MLFFFILYVQLCYLHFFIFLYIYSDWLFLHLKHACMYVYTLRICRLIVSYLLCLNNSICKWNNPQIEQIWDFQKNIKQALGDWVWYSHTDKVLNISVECSCISFENPLLFLICSERQAMRTQGKLHCRRQRKQPVASSRRSNLKMTMLPKVHWITAFIAGC